MPVFLIKTNCELYFGGAEPRPKSASQWEGRSITLTLPTRVGDAQVEQITSGDTLIIWAHEDENFGKGLGLTATAEVGEVNLYPDYAQAVMKNVRLLRPHIRLDELPEHSGSQMIDYMRSFRHRRTYALSEDEVTEFWAAIEPVKTQKIARIALYSPPLEKNAVEKALEDNQLAISAAFDRKWNSVETRPDQAAFRKALMQLYEGRCLISGSRVRTVLEAAHIIPFSENVVYRNDLKNGVLLRADIHILFDRLLIAIDPKESRVHVSPTLKGSVYEKLNGKAITHHANVEFLARHFTEVCSRSKSPLV